MSSNKVNMVGTYKVRTYYNTDRTKYVKFEHQINAGRRAAPSFTFYNSTDSSNWSLDCSILSGPGFDTPSDFSITSTFVKWLDNDHYMVLGGRDAFLYKNTQYLHTVPYFTHETGYDHIILAIDPMNTRFRTYNHHETGEPMYEFQVYYAVNRAEGYDPDDCDMVRTFRFVVPPTPAATS